MTSILMLRQEKSPQISSLDYDILLAHALKKPRSYLYAFPEYQLTTSEEKFFFELLQRRMLGEPIAYLTGHQEFWSLDFIVTPDTLIPRPETELLVELILKHFANESISLADLGTGAGAIALSLAKARPDWSIYATDHQPKALAIARQNAKHLVLETVHFYEGDWCQALPHQHFDCIVSNPPYIDPNDTHCDQTVKQYEPHSALFSYKGLADITMIIETARAYLKPGGYLFLEHGFKQGPDVAKLLAKAGYTNINLFTDLAGLDRVTMAQYNVNGCVGD